MEKLLEQLKGLESDLQEIDAYIDSDEFKELSILERGDIICQEHAMVLYQRFLGSRCVRAGLINETPIEENGNK